MRRLGLRGRMVLAISIVVALMIILVGGVTVAVTAAQSAAVQNRLLEDKLSAAQLLAQRNVAPRRIVEQLAEPGVRVIILDGTRRIAGSDRPDATWQTRQARLGGRGASAGTTVRISLAPGEADRARRQVVTTLVVTGIVALAVGALLAVLAAQVALAPLNRMARTAQEIAGGARGRRLGRSTRSPDPDSPDPDSPDTESPDTEGPGPAAIGVGTELGRTAAAVDAMLDELEGAETRARRAEERMRDFVGDAAHELRTPLAGIRAAGEALQHTADPAVRDHLETLLVRESVRAGALVDDLLEVARLDAGVHLHPAPMPLLAVAHDHHQRISTTHPRIRVHVEGPDGVVDGDRRRIDQIVGNLVDNAVRAAGEDGWVTLVVTDRGDRVELDVTDSGPGVADADQEVIFDRLVRRRSGGRAGLGLSIARGYARAHHGDLICLRSAEHRGASFRLTLPVPPGPAHSPEQQP